MKKGDIRLLKWVPVLFAVVFAVWIPHTVLAADSKAAEGDSVRTASIEAGTGETASEELIPLATNNLRNYRIKNSYLAVSDDGFTRFFLDGDDLCVESYTDDFRITGRKIIAKELSIFGGFYSGSDAYYLVFGENNTAEDTSAEVIRVVKYDKDWNRIGAANLKGDSAFGHEVRYPFDAGNVSLAECDGTLYLVTGHEGYVDAAVGQGHQGFLMYAVDESTMQGKIIDADLWHSFSQHIAIKDSGHIYVLEESEGSEQTTLSAGSAAQPRNTSISLLNYGGHRTSAWAVPTYASADALALSDDSILAVGTSIDQSRYNDTSYEKTYNIYLTVTPINSFSEASTEFRWMTNDNAADGYANVKLTKVNDSCFMLSWENDSENVSSGSEEEEDSLSTPVLHYLFLDGHGKNISKEYTAEAPISECDPVVKNGKVVYYAADGSSLAFYMIDPKDGAFQKKVYQTAGRHALWSYKDGTLTITGTGEMYDNLSENAFSGIRDKVKTLVISDGITRIGAQAFSDMDALTEIRLPHSLKEIGSNAFEDCGALKALNIPDGVETLGDSAFSGMDALTQIRLPHTLKEIGRWAFAGCDTLRTVRIPNGVKTLGEKAFYNCDVLESVYLPKSVTSIGKSAFSTGYYRIDDYSEIVSAVFYCETGSGAQTYAKNNRIRYILADEALKDKDADYSGKAIAMDSGSDSDYEPARKIVYTYYTDAQCTKKTDSASGASAEGSAPVKVGTYYVTAHADADDVFEAYTSNPAKLSVHKYSLAKVKNGVARLKCNDCGLEKKANVPTSFEVWWRADSNDEYYSSYLDDTQNLGATIECWIADIDSIGNASDSLYDMVVKCSNPDAAVITGSGTDWTIRWTKAGRQKITIYPRYNPELKESYTYYVKDPSGSVSMPTAEETGLQILQKADDEAPAGAQYGTLQLQAGKVKKTSVQIKWQKISGASGYSIYGGSCGGRFKKLKTITSANTTSWTQKKLKSGKYYKYLVMATAVDSQGVSRAAAISESVHVITVNSRYCNYKSVKLKTPKTGKITLATGETVKIKTSQVKESEKKTVKSHRALRFESSDSNVAAVGSKGKVTAKSAGTCTIYVYNQSGACRKIQVTVV